MSKKFTWGELREFCNALPEEHLKSEVVFVSDDGETQKYAGVALSGAVYVHPDDTDDIWDEKTFLSEKESGGIENPEDYEFYPAGRPFLTDECDGLGWQPVVKEIQE